MRNSVPASIVQAGIVATIIALVGACGGSAPSVASSGPTAAAVTSQPASPSPVPKPPDIAALGPVTLRILSNGEDDYTKKVDRGFEAKFPNVKVAREVKPFADLQATAKLILSGSNVPDLVNIAQGLPFMGVVVKAKLLRALDDDAQLYGWTDRFAPSLLALNRVAEDGSKWGTGKLYGLSDGAEILGVFYNKAKLAKLGKPVPATWDDFLTLLADAKAAGETPIMVGGLDKWMPPFVFEQVQSALEDKDFTRNWAYGTTSESFDRPGNVEAATVFQGWASKGYFNEGFLGLPAEEAQKKFAGGEGLLFAQATGWIQLFQQQVDPGAIGFFVMPGKGQVVSHGNLAVSYAIPTKSAHPEVAAAYLDLLTSPLAQDLAAENGLLPATNATTSSQTSPLFKDAQKAWQDVQTADGFVPYLLSRSESMFTTLQEKSQELLAGRIAPEAFIKAIDSDATH